MKIQLGRGRSHLLDYVSWGRSTIMQYIGIVAAIALGSAAVFVPIKAQSGEVYAHGFSYHYINRIDGINEIHPGISYKWTIDDLSETKSHWAHVGVVENSINNTSLFLLTGYEHDVGLDDFSFGYGVGVATGYEEYSTLPVAGGFIQYKFVHLSIFPGVAALSFKTGISF